MQDDMEKPDFLTEEQLADVVEYLYQLRDSGRTNMFGAHGYVMREWNDTCGVSLTSEQAMQVVRYWMRTVRKHTA